jgi:hypothetical protein
VSSAGIRQFQPDPRMAELISLRSFLDTPAQQMLPAKVFDSLGAECWVLHIFDGVGAEILFVGGYLILKTLEWLVIIPVDCAFILSRFAADIHYIGRDFPCPD